MDFYILDQDELVTDKVVEEDDGLKPFLTFVSFSNFREYLCNSMCYNSDIHGVFSLQCNENINLSNSTMVKWIVYFRSLLWNYYQLKLKD